MKALTIAVPYPSLILLPDDHPHKKRVENRTWPTSYRGPLLIHSGKSRKWEGTYDPRFEATLPKHYGFIVGVVDLIDCIEIWDKHRLADRIAKRHAANAKYPWLLSHHHASGPYCWILHNARRFAEPIPYTGQQGLFYVPDSVVAEQMEKL